VKVRSTAVFFALALVVMSCGETVRDIGSRPSSTPSAASSTSVAPNPSASAAATASPTIAPTPTVARFDPCPGNPRCALILSQIDQLAGDSGINGINLLGGNNLTITLNESGTSTVVVNGFNDTTGGALAISNSTNNWAAATDIDTAASDLTTALVTLRSQGQALSSNLQTVQIRQDFTKAMVNTLTTGADGLTLADSNEEGANLLALQTRQQLSTTALSLAAQADQNVLRLFN